MLYNKLKKYTGSEVYPFHMPGHKRQDITGEGVIPYGIDLTEIPGFDNLHNPSGCIKNIEAKAAELYGVKHAFISVNGATGATLSAIRSMTCTGDRVLMARNCHKSVYNAVELMNLKPEYIFPDTEICGKKYSFYGVVSPGKLDEKLKAFPDTKLVIITSPTYEGICSDIRKIAEVCHQNNAYLFVDEAHGAHFPFHKAFPESAISQGADAAVVSLHKTLPSLTQTALLLTNDSGLNIQFRGNLAVFESSSPSYILMASVDCCLDYLENSHKAFDEYVDRLKLFHKRTKLLKKLSVFSPRKADDIGKIIILTADTNLTGHKLAEILRNDFKIETEMSSVDYVTAVTSVCDSGEGFKRLYDALLEIDSKCTLSQNVNSLLLSKSPERMFLPCEKYRYNSVLTGLENLQGKISLEYVYAYPPGIPVIVPGEVLAKDIIDYINYQINSGVEIISSEKNMPLKLSVAEM